MNFYKPKKSLPPLTSPAIAGEISKGKEVIDATGNKLTGIMKTDAVKTKGGVSLPLGWGVVGNENICTLTNSLGNVTAEDIVAGKIGTGDGGPVTGTLQTGIDTSDATATETDIAIGQTAYAKGVKLTGTAKIQGETAFPDRMEEEVLMDLTGYTYVEELLNQGYTTNVVPGAIYIGVSCNNTPSIIVSNGICLGVVGSAGDAVKFIFPPSEDKLALTNDSGSVRIFKKND